MKHRQLEIGDVAHQAENDTWWIMIARRDNRSLEGECVRAGGEYRVGIRSMPFTCTLSGEPSDDGVTIVSSDELPDDLLARSTALKLTENA